MPPNEVDMIKRAKNAARKFLDKNDEIKRCEWVGDTSGGTVFVMLSEKHRILTVHVQGKRTAVVEEISRRTKRHKKKKKR